MCIFSIQLFQRMFPCDTSKNFSLGRTKASYLFSDGLGPFLVKKLTHAINTSECGYTLMLGETTTAQVVKQMDLLIYHWCETRDEIWTEYLSSLFFGRAIAGDLLEMILKEILDSRQVQRSCLTCLLMVQISTSHYGISWMKLWRRKDLGLLPLITRTLHVIHNEFWKGLNAYVHEAEELAFDLYYWSRIAPCRWEDIQNLEKDMDPHLHKSLFFWHVDARWLTLVSSLEHVMICFSSTEK